MASRPYPLEPLEDLLSLPPRLLAQILGVSRRSVLRWRRQGLTVDQADRFAVALGHHPAEIWPTWIDDWLSREAM